MGFATRSKARELGAWSATPPAAPLWALSKRELIEIALHQAALLHQGGYDTALENGEAARSVLTERRALGKAGLI